MTGISGLPGRWPLLSDRYKQNASVTLWNQALNRAKGPGTIVPATNAAPRDEPLEQLDGSNPANKSVDGQVTYQAQRGDNLTEIARQLGYGKDLDPAVAQRFGFDKTKDTAEQYAALLAKFNPELGDNPDGLPETHVITVLSDERVQRLQQISTIAGGAKSVEDLPQAKRTELQDLIDADLAPIGGTMDQKDFDATRKERAAYLRAVLPQMKGLGELVESRAEDFGLHMDGLFSGLRDSAAQGQKTGDWSAFQTDVAEALRRRINPPPPAQTPEFDADQAAADFIAELSFYGPMDPKTLKVDAGYLKAIQAAQHQVMVTDPAKQVTDGASLELTLTGVPAERADQILVELSKLPATGKYRDEENPPASRLAEIVYPLRKLSSKGTVSDEAKKLIGNLNVVATQAGASAPIDGKGRMQVSDGVSQLAALMAEANTGGLDRKAPYAHAGDLTLRTAITDSIAQGDGATLAVAMAAHYADEGWAKAADNMLHTVAFGVERLTPEARGATEAYGRLIGDPQWAGSYLEGLRDDKELAGAVQTVQNGKLKGNPEQVAKFERLFAGAMSTDAILQALPASLRNLKGDNLGGYDRLKGAQGDLRHLLVGNKDDGDDAPPPMVQVAMAGMPAPPKTLTLAEVERQLQQSPEFKQYETLYRNISDPEFDAVFGDALDTYDKIQRQLADPKAKIIELPPGMTSLPPTVTEVLDGLKGKDRPAALDALRDKPAQGAALLMTLDVLENGQPNGPSGGFLSREIKNSSLLLSTVMAPSSPIAQAVANRANGGANGEAAPRDGLLGSRAAAIPVAGVSGALNIWGVREFLASDRPDDKAWAGVFGLLAGMDVARGTAAGIQSLLIPQGRHVRPATGLPSLFNQGGRLDRMTRFGYVGGPGLYRTLGTASSVLTVGVAAWTASIEFSNGNVLGGTVWTSMGLASGVEAGLVLAGSSWAGPVGWVAAGVWLVGASILHWQSSEKQRRYFEGDTRAILANLNPPVDPERAEILAEGRDDFGASDKAKGRPLFPLLEQLAEYRGYDTPAEKKEFFDYILYNTAALPNDKLRELAERTTSSMLINLDDDSYMVDSKVATGYSANPITIAQLSDWIDGVKQHDIGSTNPGIRLPPRRN
ncbi:hypothetical protein AB4Z01_06955 [Inquilinus sp. YAF38]|uniref:hypothetical protein n=1 Tax=Inquilinus sp. YAF38 TaxID=3233084 RepID=UPI003F9304BA